MRNTRFPLRSSLIILLLIWACSGLSTHLMAQDGTDMEWVREPADRGSIERHRWNRRVIVLLHHSEVRAALEQQLQILRADLNGLEERDLLVYSSDCGKAPQLCREYGAGEGFVFLLIGKDGGEKLRSDLPVSLDRLFALIDAMPMRRREIEQQGKSTPE